MASASLCLAIDQLPDTNSFDHVRVCHNAGGAAAK